MSFLVYNINFKQSATLDNNNGYYSLNNNHVYNNNYYDNYYDSPKMNYTSRLVDSKISETESNAGTYDKSNTYKTCNQNPYSLDCGSTTCKEKRCGNPGNPYTDNESVCKLSWDLPVTNDFETTSNTGYVKFCYIRDETIPKTDSEYEKINPCLHAIVKPTSKNDKKIINDKKKPDDKVFQNHFLLECNDKFFNSHMPNFKEIPDPVQVLGPCSDDKPKSKYCTIESSFNGLPASDDDVYSEVGNYSKITNKFEKNPCINPKKCCNTSQNILAL